MQLIANISAELRFWDHVKGGRERWITNKLSGEDREVLKRLGIEALPDTWTQWREQAISARPAQMLASGSAAS